MDDASVAALSQRVDGYMKPEDCVQLYRELRATPLDGEALEIGSFKGRVTVCLAQAQKEKGAGPVYTVDSGLFGGRKEFHENIRREGMAGMVFAIDGNSAQVNRGWKKPLSFIWIDTDATLFSLSADFMLWERFLQPGGVFAWGGATHSAGKAFAEKTLAQSGRFGEVRTGAWIMYARKERQGREKSAVFYAYIRTLYRLYYWVKRVHHSCAGRCSHSLLEKDHFLKRAARAVFQRLLR